MNENKSFLTFFQKFLSISSFFAIPPPPPPPPPVGIKSSLFNFASLAFSWPKWYEVALFFWVLAISFCCRRQSIWSRDFFSIPSTQLTSISYMLWLAGNGNRFQPNWHNVPWFSRRRSLWILKDSLGDPKKKKRLRSYSHLKGLHNPFRIWDTAWPPQKWHLRLLNREVWTTLFTHIEGTRSWIWVVSAVVCEYIPDIHGLH